MKRVLTISKLVTLLLLVTAASARASAILDVTSALVAGDPTQLGRLSRNAIAQTWADDEVFPGVINTGTSYAYHTYTVNVGSTPFVQVNINSASPNTFVSAYNGSYNPASLGTNWLGDAGLSGNQFGNPIYFQVVVPLNGDLVIVVNQTAAGAGIGDPFGLLVEGFLDTEFTEPSDTTPPTPVPEPATMILGGSGLAIMALKRRFARAA